MEEKRRIAGTGEEIVVHAPDGEMPSLVHGIVQLLRERGEIVDFQERGHVVPADVVAPGGPHVPRQTSRVVVEPRAGADPAGERGVGVDGAEIDGHVRKRARGETASAILRGHGTNESPRVGDYIRPSVMRDFLAVTRQRGVRAVEQRRGNRIVGECRPFPVGLMASIAAL